MESLRRILAIALADLRERTRTTRFWVVLALVAASTWVCFPAAESGMLAIAVDNGRGYYSSAWIGLALGLMYSTLLGFAGFYLVRGTLVRDFDTRVWQLMVATPMTRAGYLVAKWASHMAVFALVLAIGLGVGVAAQYVRGEVLAFDPVELVKPVLVLTLPALSLTAFFAILFDMLPPLRRTGGNVVYFFVWMLLFAVMSMSLDAKGVATQAAMSDPAGMSLVHQSLRQAVGPAMPGLDVEQLAVGMGEVKGRPVLFHWDRWNVAPHALPARLFWLLLGLAASAALAVVLDRCAARTTVRAADDGGRRLRWLDRLMRPFERHPTGALVAAELRLALRRRRWVWWLTLLLAGIVQLAAPLNAAAIAAIVAWMAGLDVHARGALRETETRTAALVFTASHATRRVATARLLAAGVLSVGAVLPLLLRTLASGDALAAPVLLVAVSLAVCGMAFGAVFRSPRPYELVLALLAYVGVQGMGPLALAGQSRAMSLGIVVALIAASVALVVAWPRLVAASRVSR